MFFLLVALFFAWLALREVRSSQRSVDGFDRFSRIYVVVCLSLTLAFGWGPVKTRLFEYNLAAKASLLAGGLPVTVHCNTALDAIFDNALNVAGHANPDTGEIVFQLSWCDQLVDYLAAPHSADSRVRYSLMLFTHEVMHIRGELNEQKTECQAIQRNHLAGELLGLDKDLALQHTVDYFEREYPRHPYFSDKCGPGKAYDEKLADSLWSLND